MEAKVTITAAGLPAETVAQPRSARSSFPELAVAAGALRTSRLEAKAPVMVVTEE
jgi:hypothetical protein